MNVYKVTCLKTERRIYFRKQIDFILIFVRLTRDAEKSLCFLLLFCTVSYLFHINVMYANFVILYFINEMRKAK